MERFNRKKIIIVSSIVLLIVLLVVLVFSLRNPYGDELTISNLDSYTNGKPSNKNSLQAAKRNLYLTINKNNKKPIGNNSIKDIVVRKGSFRQKLKNNDTLYSVSFIVDSKSLGQSYVVEYQWSRDGNPEHLEEYGAGITCLAIDQLIYGDFNCVDDRIIEQGVENYDPIEKVLPYEVEYKYTIKDYNKKSDKSIVLKVEAFIPRWGDKQKIIDSYSKDILDWIKSKKLNPDHYSLEFTY